MIKQIGTKVYYCNITGEVIQVIHDKIGSVHQTSLNEDFEMFTNLSIRNKDTVEVLTFKYGEYPKLSQGSTGVMVDLDTKELIFSYEELPQEPTEIEIMQEKISQLEEKINKLQNSINEMNLAILKG